MKVSSKSKNALKVMVDIAMLGDGYISISELAKKHRISGKYLEQIIALMAKSNLVVSMRGSSGGYKLSKNPSEISVADILTATGDMPKFSECDATSCPQKASCKTYGCWQALSELISDYLKNLSLEDLINKTYHNK